MIKKIKFSLHNEKQQEKIPLNSLSKMVFTDNGIKKLVRWNSIQFYFKNNYKYY